MAGKYIDITISPRGEMKVEGQGFQGDECRAYTKPLIDKLGEITSDEPKEEGQSEQETVSA